MMCHNHCSLMNSEPGDKTMDNTPTQNMTSLTAARRCPRTPDHLLDLACYIRCHRYQIQLSVPEAARRAGIDARDWYAVEGGWIPPEHDYRLHAIADALGVGRIQIEFGAALTRSLVPQEAA